GGGKLDGNAAGSKARGRSAEALEHAREGAALFRIGGNGLDGRSRDLRLQLLRRALRDDVPVVDDPDPVGEDIGLLEVLRGQEDGHALVPREAPDLFPERRAALDV